MTLNHPELPNLYAFPYRILVACDWLKRERSLAIISTRAFCFNLLALWLGGGDERKGGTNPKCKSKIEQPRHPKAAGIVPILKVR